MHSIILCVVVYNHVIDIFTSSLLATQYSSLYFLVIRHSSVALGLCYFLLCGLTLVLCYPSIWVCAPTLLCLIYLSIHLSLLPLFPAPVISSHQSINLLPFRCFSSVIQPILFRLPISSIFLYHPFIVLLLVNPFIN